MNVSLIFPYYINHMVDCLCSLDFSVQETYEAKRHEFFGELQRREEEMRQTFVQRVKEKEAILKEAEREVCMPLFFYLI